MVRRKQSGFTLIEMAIVLIVIGLLAGGIIAGRHLVRSGDIQDVTRDLDYYSSIVGTFQDTYYALPGDMPNATAQWGAAHATPATCATTASTGKETCDGNGDGKIDDMATASTDDYEQFRFWQQLVNAGLMEARFTGVAGGGGTAHAVPGSNVPESSFNGGGFAVVYAGNLAADANLFDGFYTHVMMFGAPSAAGYPNSPLLTTEEMYNLDLKMDDGKPGSGAVRSAKGSSAATPDCTTTDDPATAEYDLAYTDRACSLLFLPGF